MIRKDVSAILGFPIQEGKWEDVFKAADIQGKLTGSRTNQILRLLCEAVEALEVHNDSEPIVE